MAHLLVRRIPTYADMCKNFRVRVRPGMRWTISATACFVRTWMLPTSRLARRQKEALGNSDSHGALRRYNIVATITTDSRSNTHWAISNEPDEHLAAACFFYGCYYSHHYKRTYNSGFYLFEANWLVIICLNSAGRISRIRAKCSARRDDLNCPMAAQNTIS